MFTQSPKYIDVHSHLNFVAYDADREAVLKRAEEAGVWMVNVGTQKDTSQSAVALAEKSGRGVFAAVGLHPIHTAKSFHDKSELGGFGKEFTSRGEEFDSAIYRTIAQNPKVVAIGECGLDYYRITNNELRITKKRQEDIFRKQIELAIELNKPLMLHLRSGESGDAYNEAFQILNSYFAIHNSKLRGDLHCFAGTWEQAKKFINIGFSLSFTGIITFSRDYDEIVKNAPIDRIMSETDCPYLSPAPYRGKRNEPSYVVEVVKKIAEIRNVDFETVRAQLVENALKFFGIKKQN